MYVGTVTGCAGCTVVGWYHQFNVKTHIQYVSYNFTGAYSSTARLALQLVSTELVTPEEGIGTETGCVACRWVQNQF